MGPGRANYAGKLPPYWLANSALAAERSEVKRALNGGQDGGKLVAKYAQNGKSKGGAFKSEKQQKLTAI